TLFPAGPAAVQHAVTSDGSNTLIQLSQTLNYFGRTYSQLYLSMDGYLSFQSFYYDTYVPMTDIDIIAPLWTDVDIYTRGNIYYEQATSGALLQTATNEMNMMFPGFTPSWVFVGTWEKVEFEPDTGEVTFQVVLVSDNAGHTFILMNYGPIPDDPEPWLAGLQNQENNNLAIQTSSTSDLSTVTNVGIPGRWVFQVSGAKFVPSADVSRLYLRRFTMLLSLMEILYWSSLTRHSPILEDDTRSSILMANICIAAQYGWLSMDGYLSSQYLSTDGYSSYYQYYNNMDIIAPLWTDIDTYTRGDISYKQATSGPLLQLATNAVNHHFPAANTSASWVLVATWDKVEFEPDNGEVTFQVVLISCEDGSSFILMNYGDMPVDPLSWMAGYVTADHAHQYTIQATSTSVLKTTTNVGKPGRWAFQVNDPVVLFPVLSSAVHHSLTYDAQVRLIQLDQTFTYFGRPYTQLYLSMDGYLSSQYLSTDGYSSYYQYYNNMDIIAPLWTDVDTYTRGDISYEQATSGPLLQLATNAVNHHFPAANTSAIWDPLEGGTSPSGPDSPVEERKPLSILMNYGEHACRSVILDVERSLDVLVIKTDATSTPSSASQYPCHENTTNVGRPGRCAFQKERYRALTSVCFGGDFHTVVLISVDGWQLFQILMKNSGTCLQIQSPVDVGSARSVSLSRCQLFDAGFATEVLHLNDPSCRGEMQEDRVVFHFNNDTCGTVLQTNQTHIIFENSIQAFSGAGSRSVISRDSWLNVTFYCAYPLTQKISMPMRFQATAGVVSKNLPGAEGTYQIRMVPYTDATYTTPYSGNIILQVNTQIFVAVDVVGVSSQRFSTVLDSCWATPYDDINYYIHWDLVIKECPNPKDGTVQILQNGVSTSSHFSFKMFTFTGLTDSFFLHCQVHLCLLNGGECALPCDDDDGDADDRKVRRQRSLDFHDTASISMSF
ncbi:hypothetical protein NFI96_030563, partial [Prochilodus magdalenae]